MRVHAILAAIAGLVLLALPQSTPIHAEELASANLPAVIKGKALLIVAPRSFQKELEPFVEHKKSICKLL